ncbi:MAG: hypothetical protein HYV32_06395 [Candidatus Kerfeldbacteria bacterium]|nr:hypothetical protein [Candidatus Kerfeldbacteria bacterium]
MGTEIFPKILFFIQFVVGTIGVVTLLTVLISFISLLRHRNDKKMITQMREQIVSGLIAFIIILIVYVLFSGIGPAFRVLFSK